jgi:hypothetical protein
MTPEVLLHPTHITLRDVERDGLGDGVLGCVAAEEERLRPDEVHLTAQHLDDQPMGDLHCHKGGQKSPQGPAFPQTSDSIRRSPKIDEDLDTNFCSSWTRRAAMGFKSLTCARDSTSLCGLHWEQVGSVLAYRERQVPILKPVPRLWRQAR